jgi:hypothetical protein
MIPYKTYSSEILKDSGVKPSIYESSKEAHEALKKG